MERCCYSSTRSTKADRTHIREEQRLWNRGGRRHLTAVAVNRSQPAKPCQACASAPLKGTTGEHYRRGMCVEMRCCHREWAATLSGKGHGESLHAVSYKNRRRHATAGTRAFFEVSLFCSSRSRLDRNRTFCPQDRNSFDRPPRLGAVLRAGVMCMRPRFNVDTQPPGGIERHCQAVLSPEHSVRNTSPTIFR